MDARRPDPDDHRDLLAAYRDVERMPAAARAAAWRDIQTSIHAPAPAPRRADLRPFAWAAALLAAAVLLFLLRPAELAPASTTADPQESMHDVDDPPPTPVHPSPRPPRAEPPPAPRPEPPPPAASPARRSPPRPAPPPILEPTPSPIPDLERELALLRAARDALTRGDPTAAMAALAEHADQFAAGHLREERLVLRVEALCAAGSRDDARREATRFADAHPASPHAKKILRVCTDAPTDPPDSGKPPPQP